MLTGEKKRMNNLEDKSKGMRLVANRRSHSACSESQELGTTASVMAGAFRRLGR